MPVAPAPDFELPSTPIPDEVFEPNTHAATVLHDVVAALVAVVDKAKRPATLAASRLFTT